MILTRVMTRNNGEKVTLSTLKKKADMFLREAGCLLFILYISGVQGQTNSICALKGSSVNLSCSVGGSAADKEYKWFTVFMNGSKCEFHEVVVDGNQKKYRISEGSRPILTINDLNKNDEKRYVCCESVDKPDICCKNQTVLHVEELQVKVLPSKHAQTVTLLCNSSSSCPFTQKHTGFLWFKNRQLLYQDQSPWYQELVSGEEAVAYSCAVKGHQDFRAPEVSVDLVTPACFRVTYSGGSMCSSGNKQCSIVLPIEISLNRTSADQDHVKLTCSSSCSSTEPQASIVLLKNGNPENQKTFSLSSTDIFTCAVKELQDIHSADVCVDNSSCWSVKCFPKRVCALKGSSLNISCEYSHPRHQQPTVKHWFKIIRNINKTEKEITEEKNMITFHDDPNQHNLRFEKLSKNDSAEYVFRIGTNSNELKESIFPEVTLIVTDVKVKIRPSSEVTEGQRVTLTCSTSCPLTHNSNFSWYLNHQPLKVENKHLFIDAATSRDAGNYTCVVKTKANKQTKSQVKTLTVKNVNQATPAAFVGGVSAVVLVCLAVFLWIRKKRTFAQSSSSEAANNLNTLNSDHLYEEIPAEATDCKPHHSQVNHENTLVYSTIQAHQDQQLVPYGITKVRQKSDLEMVNDIL